MGAAEDASASGLAVELEMTLVVSVAVAGAVELVAALPSISVHAAMIPYQLNSTRWPTQIPQGLTRPWGCLILKGYLNPEQYLHLYH